ncbi:MAG: outer membrane protein transport protein, partial [Deltaproteobacteria bacterium]|nr:outer membrane protein transport protein [Deltaproteobacteria bacterium]
MHDQLAVSTKALSLGNAVTAYPPGLMSIHYNPAGLTLLPDNQLSAGMLYALQMTRTERFSKGPDFEGFMGQNDDPGMGAQTMLAAPNIGLSHREPGSKWTVAFGSYIPYGVGLSIDDYNRDNNNPIRFGGSALYNQRMIYAAPAIAYKMTDTLSVGLSVGVGQAAEAIQGMHMRAPSQMTAMVDELGKATAGLEIPVLSELTLPPPWFGGGLRTYEAVGNLNFDMHDDVTTSFNIGFLWEPRDWFSFGACYQSASKANLRGHYKIEYSQEWQNLVNWMGRSPLT